MWASTIPEQRRDRDLANRAGDGQRADREQVLRAKMQADAEHQQDDTDLGEVDRPGPGRRQSPA